MKREGLVRRSPDVNERHGLSECLFIGGENKRARTKTFRHDKSTEKRAFGFIFIGFECLIMTTCTKSERCEGGACNTSLLTDQCVGPEGAR